jgi:DNA polymerase-3 subunit alpha
MIAVRATVDRRPGSEETNLIVNEIIPVDDLPKRHARGVVMRIHEEDHDVRVLEQLREIVRGYPGNKTLTLLLCLTDGWQVRLDCSGHRVNLCAELRRRVSDLLGPGNFLLLTDTRPPAPSNGNGHGSGKTFSRQ